ncbi:hypothetical protein F383_38199 [Gossypium arboreum]
MPGPN